MAEARPATAGLAPQSGADSTMMECASNTCGTAGDQRPSATTRMPGLSRGVLSRAPVMKQ